MNTQELHNKLDKEYQRNKENIRCRLVGTSKRYNAHQCYIFAQNVKFSGWNRYTADEIDYVYFTKHSVTIKLISTAETDLKRFNTANEMFAWVAGFNECMFQIEREGTPHTIITN
tara:strand:- start:5 stop:349 length:345 start_codon:yes stop_codon:yes gene_type:complete